MGVRGKVYLVGAGPGDPGLITVRGRACLERADVVIYDSLVNEEILSWAERAEKIFVGKRRDRHVLPQEDINRILIEQAQRVGNVVRLKGGDVFVFGRGGEEALALAEAGIPFEVVPGITAGLAAPAYAGIPVTHRGWSASVTLITGHRDPSLPDSIDFSDAPRDGCLVIYMGLSNLDAIVAELLRSGWPGRTPAAVIENGTLPNQRTVSGALETIADAAQSGGIKTPAVIVVGEVAGLRDRLQWFEQRSLSGVRVGVVAGRSRKLASLLRERGAEVFEFPAIEIAPLEDDAPALDVGAYDWIVLSSVNGVEHLFHRLESEGQDARALSTVKICAIGQATVDAVRARSILPDCTPAKWGGTEVAEAMERTGGPLTGKRVLLPRADLVRSSLREELERRQARVTELLAYTTAIPGDASSLADALIAFAPDCLTFTNSAAAINFAEILGPDRSHAFDGARFASIGPATTSTLEELGFEVSIEPREHRLEALVSTIVDRFSAGGGAEAEEGA